MEDVITPDVVVPWPVEEKSFFERLTERNQERVDTEKQRLEWKGKPVVKKVTGNPEEPALILGERSEASRLVDSAKWKVREAGLVLGAVAGDSSISFESQMKIERIAQQLADIGDELEW